MFYGLLLRNTIVLINQQKLSYTVQILGAIKRTSVMSDSKSQRNPWWLYLRITYSKSTALGDDKFLAYRIIRLYQFDLILSTLSLSLYIYIYISAQYKGQIDILMIPSAVDLYIYIYIYIYKILYLMLLTGKEMFTHVPDRLQEYLQSTSF